MKLIHVLKNGNEKQIPLSKLRYETRHEEFFGEVTHQGWVVMGDFDEKSHTYGLLFSPEEAKEFRDKLDKMLARFDVEELP